MNDLCICEIVSIIYIRIDQYVKSPFHNHRAYRLGKHIDKPASLRVSVRKHCSIVHSKDLKLNHFENIYFINLFGEIERIFLKQPKIKISEWFQTLRYESIIRHRYWILNLPTARAVAPICLKYLSWQQNLLDYEKGDTFELTNEHIYWSPFQNLISIMLRASQKTSRLPSFPIHLLRDSFRAKKFQAFLWLRMDEKSSRFIICFISCTGSEISFFMCRHVMACIMISC